MKAAQYITNFNETHWKAVEHIFCYISGTTMYGITLGNINTTNKSTLHLFGSSDVDWAGSMEDRHSMTGNILLLNGGPIIWTSKKQSTIATSTMQAKYQALSSLVKDIIWTRSILSELGFKTTTPTPIEQDNQVSIALANNPTNHPKAKHIDITHHFI